MTGMPRIMKLTQPSKCGASSLPTEVEVGVTDNPILESSTFSGKSKIRTVSTARLDSVRIWLCK